MPKLRPEPFWRKQSRCYYVQFGKKQHRLDPNEETAWRLYHEMMARPPDAVRIPNSSTTSSAVESIDLILGWASVNRECLTNEAYKRRLQHLIDGIPPTLAHTDLKPFQITRVIDAKDWNANWAPPLFLAQSIRSSRSRPGIESCR